MKVDRFLLELIGDIQDYGCDLTDGKKKVSNNTLANHLTAHGVGLTPLTPGPDADNINIAEMAFHNGEAHMKEKVTAMLQGMRAHVTGLQFAQLCNILEEVADL